MIRWATDTVDDVWVSVTFLARTTINKGAYQRMTRNPKVMSVPDDARQPKATCGPYWFWEILKNTASPQKKRQRSGLQPSQPSRKKPSMVSASHKTLDNQTWKSVSYLLRKPVVGSVSYAAKKTSCLGGVSLIARKPVGGKRAYMYLGNR